MAAVVYGDPSDPHNPAYFMGNQMPSATAAGGSEKEGTLEFDVEGMTPEQAKKWVEFQIPYSNLASDKEVGKRAVAFVRNAKQRWEEGTQESREKWRSMQYMLRSGNTLSSRFENSDLHVAELFKNIEAIVPRIEEAVLQYDPWFKVIGAKGEMSKSRGAKVQGLMRHQLRQDNFDQKVQPSIRAMVEYSFCSFKVWWDIKSENRIEKEVIQTEVKGGKKKYRIFRRPTKKIVFNGPRMSLIDPLDFIIDPNSILPPYDCLYVGDERYITFEDLVAEGRLFGYQNMDELLGGSRTVGDTGARDFDKQSRSLERFSAVDRRHAVQGAPKQIRVAEIWGMFDPEGGNNARPHVLTIANGKIPLRVQENFHDDKHIPYVAARASREGWEFLNVGPADHALPISISIDEHRNLVRKSHENALAPPLVTDNIQGLPDNMFDVAPGSVWRCANPQNLKWYPAPSTLNEYAGFFEIERRDIEEIIGSPRIWEGTQGGNTATEVERKVQEANRRLRGYVLSYSFMLEQILKQMHSLNQQWVTEDIKYAVLGKAAYGLDGVYDEIGPAELVDDVEFEMVGVSMLASQGLRGTQLATFASTIYPLIPLMPQGTVDLAELVKQLYEAQVGIAPAERIIKIKAGFADMMPQSKENMILAGGEQVEVNSMDDDAAHIEEMLAFFGELEQKKLTKKFGADGAMSILMHFEGHKESSERKALRRKAEIQEAKHRMLTQGQGEGIDNGRGTTGNRVEAGGGFGLDVQGPAPQRNPRGEAPGMGSAQQVGAPDRRTPVPQTANREKVPS